MLTKLELYLIGFLVLAGAVTGAYFYAKHQGVTEERERWETKEAGATKADLESLTEAVQAGNVIAKDTADKLGKQKSQQIIDRGVIRSEIQTNTVYAADCFPASGRLLWNSISAGNPLVPTSPTGPVPAPVLPQGNVPAGSGQSGGNPAPKPSGR